MSKLQSPKRIQRGDIPNADPYFLRFLDSYNQDISRIFEAVGGKLTAADNLNAEVRVLTVKHLVQFEFRLLKLNGKPSRLTVSQVVNPQDFAEIKWGLNPTDNAIVRATMKFDSAGTGDFTVRLLIEGD